MDSAADSAAAEAASGDSAEAAPETIAIDVPSPAGPSLLEKYTAHYPEWAKEYARKYFTKTLT